MPLRVHNQHSCFWATRLLTLRVLSSERTKVRIKRLMEFFVSRYDNSVAAFSEPLFENLNL